MKYKCLVLDHDDTVVNSTATIHLPCFMQYLSEKYPHLTDRYDLSTYFRKNFDPGVVALFRDEIGMSIEKSDVKNIGEIVKDTFKRSTEYEQKIEKALHKAVYNVGHSDPVGAKYLLKRIVEMQEARK